MQNVVRNYKIHLMFRQLIIIMTVVMFTSCGQNNQQEKMLQNTDSTTIDSIAVLNDPKNNLNIQTNSFSEIDSSGVLMFPLSTRESERDGSSLSYKEMPNDSYWNIIFLNGNTNEYHLLSDKKMLIKNYNHKHSGIDNADIAQTKRNIFYSIISTDYNKDNKFNDEDPKYLYISDKSGNNFRQISPSNYDFQDWQYIKSINKILLKVKKDSDKNNKFDGNDEVTTFEVDIDKGTEPKEVFSIDFKNKLKILYDRDWKRLKK